MTEAFLADIRFALRWLRRSPGFAVVAVASLAVGIGVNTALFTIVDALLLRPLPVRDPATLVDVYTSGSDGDTYATSSYPDYLDLRAHNDVLVDLAGHSPMLAPLNLGDRSRLAVGELVTGNYFELLGVGAARGRVLEPADDRLDAASVVVVSHRYWTREMGTDPQAIGRTLRIRGRAYTVVGIAPETFTGMVPMLAPELWLPAVRAVEVEPMGIQDAVPSPTGTNRLERRGQRWMFMKGRVKPGVTAEQVQANLQVAMAELASAWPQTNKDRRIAVKWTRDVRVHPAGDALLSAIGAGLMFGVGLMLLVACANVASMLLARSTARQREIGIRLAVGASRGRLVRQLVTESLVIAALGATAGIGLAFWLTRLLADVHVPIPIPVVIALGLDARALVFTTGATVVAALAAGLVPALRASRPDLVMELRGDAAGVAQGLGGFTLRDALVAGQVAFTLTLLVAAALLMRSLAASQQARIGFDPGGIALVSTDLGMAGYDDTRGQAVFNEALARVRALPGVQQAALAARWPFSINFTQQQFYLPDVHTPGDKPATLQVTWVSPEYFETLGVPILGGRTFAASDTPGSPGVAIVNDTMARRYWPGQSALGRRLRLRGPDGPAFEVVGVAADHKVQTVGEAPQPYVHFATTQRVGNGYAIMARTRGDAGALVADIQRVMIGIEPNVVFIDHQTMAAQVDATLFPVRAGSWLIGLVGAIAMVLAAVGLYGAIAYSVARRTREIGIRMAIGAERGGVLRLVMRQGLRVALAGIAAGAVLATGVAFVIRGWLYGITAADPVAWGAAVGLVLATTAVANVIPARRASLVDPSIALRAE